MSIIHDALKKSGQPVIADGKQTPQTAASGVKTTRTPLRPPVEGTPKRASASWGPLLIVALLLVIAGPVLAPMFSGSSNTAASRTVSVGDNASPARQFAIEEVPAPPRNFFQNLGRANTPVPFVLSGVVYSALNSGKDSYCLINGQVLRQGESAGDAVIERITPEEVTLNRNGERILLPVVTG